MGKKETKFLQTKYYTRGNRWMQTDEYKEMGNIGQHDKQ